MRIGCIKGVGPDKASGLQDSPIFAQELRPQLFEIRVVRLN